MKSDWLHRGYEAQPGLTGYVAISKGANGGLFPQMNKNKLRTMNI